MSIFSKTRPLQAAIIALSLVFSFGACTGTQERAGSVLDSLNASEARSTVPPSLEPLVNYYFMSGHMAKLEGDFETAADNFYKVLSIDPGARAVKRELVEVLFNMERAGEAVELAEGLLAETPDDVLLIEMLGQTYSARNEYDKAIPMMEKLISLSPENTEAYLHLAVLYGSSEQVGKARKTLRQLLSVDKKAAISALYYIGVLTLGSGDLNNAESIFLELKEYGMDSDSLYLNLGAIKDKKGQHKRAETYYKKAIEVSPANLAAMENLAQLYIRTERPEDALRVLDEMEAIAPGNTDATRRRALLLINLSRFESAVVALKDVIKAEPEDMQFRYYLGLAYEEMGKYDEAINEYQKMIAADPSNIKPYISLGYLYIQLDMYDEAEDAYTTLLSISEPMAEYYIYLGRIYSLKGEKDKAEETFLKGINSFVENDELHFNIAVLYEEKDDLDAMVKHLQSAIEINPEHAEALNFLGYSYADRGMNLEEALSLVTRSLALKPDNGYITDSLGWVYFKMGDYDKAIKTLRKAVKLVDSDPVIYEHLGDAYMEKSNSDKALKAWARSLDTIEAQEMDKDEAALMRQRIEGKIRLARESGSN